MKEITKKRAPYNNTSNKEIGAIRMKNAKTSPALIHQSFPPAGLLQPSFMGSQSNYPGKETYNASAPNVGQQVYEPQLGDL